MAHKKHVLTTGENYFFFKISENPEECRFVGKIYFKTIFMDILLIKNF